MKKFHNFPFSGEWISKNEKVYVMTESCVCVAFLKKASKYISLNLFPQALNKSTIIFTSRLNSDDILRSLSVRWRKNLIFHLFAAHSTTNAYFRYNAFLSTPTPSALQGWWFPGCCHALHNPTFSTLFHSIFVCAKFSAFSSKWAENFPHHTLSRAKVLKGFARKL